MEDNKTEIFEQEAQGRYPVNDTTGDLYVSSKITFLHGCRFGYAYSQQSTKHLQDRIVELEKALRESIDELKVFKGDIRTQEVINNGITALNTKS